MSITDYFEPAAKQTVANVLGSSRIGKMKKFTFEGHTFDPSHLAHMYYEVTQGALNVKLDMSQSSSAYYKAGSNTLYIKFVGADSITRQALIVHETTHALFDFKAAKMDIAASESIAYIAQCLYARANSGNSDPDARLYDEKSSKDKVFEIGWEIAGKILNGGSVSSDDVSNMRSAVSHHPYYASNHGSTADFDGI